MEQTTITPSTTEPPDRHRQQARAHFDSWAESYDRSILGEIIFRPSLRICLEELARWQQEREPGPYRLLDVGCGTGNLLMRLTADPLAEELVGLDYSPEMVRRLEAKIAGAPGCGVRAVHGDAEQLPFGAAAFDVITCCNSFHHYPHQAAVLRGFRAALRPGGRCILVDGFRDNVIGWVVFDVGVGLVERHVHHAGWRAVRQMLTAAGFSSSRQRKVNVLAPLLVSVASV